MTPSPNDRAWVGWGTPKACGSWPKTSRFRCSDTGFRRIMDRSDRYDEYTKDMLPRVWSPKCIYTSLAPLQETTTQVASFEPRSKGYTFCASAQRIHGESCIPNVSLAPRLQMSKAPPVTPVPNPTAVSECAATARRVHMPKCNLSRNLIFIDSLTLACGSSCWKIPKCHTLQKHAVYIYIIMYIYIIYTHVYTCNISIQLYTCNNITN